MFSIDTILSQGHTTPKRKREDQLFSENNNLNRTWDKRARVDSSYDDYHQDDSKAVYLRIILSVYINKYYFNYQVSNPLVEGLDLIVLSFQRSFTRLLLPCLARLLHRHQ